MVEHFHKGHLETPLPKMNLSLIFGIGGHSEQKVNTKCHICFNAAPCLCVFPGLLGFIWRIAGLVNLISSGLFMNSHRAVFISALYCTTSL